ncbi:hypothetical protein T12_16310 [Trichinella patagoniensis]|uniref:Uncharacterized protein n=1 Tax=Trichinella patagoniensis TaxID=990121 RepID=A0A0V0YQS7_9BILA|nr:hypothetical protein T12_16310 [Trichinella patagoniensis]
MFENSSARIGGKLTSSSPGCGTRGLPPCSDPSNGSSSKVFFSSTAPRAAPRPPAR